MRTLLRTIFLLIVCIPACAQETLPPLNLSVPVPPSERSADPLRAGSDSKDELTPKDRACRELKRDIERAKHAAPRSMPDVADPKAGPELNGVSVNVWSTNSAASGMPAYKSTDVADGRRAKLENHYLVNCQ